MPRPDPNACPECGGPLDWPGGHDCEAWREAVKKIVPRKGTGPLKINTESYLPGEPDG